MKVGENDDRALTGEKRASMFRKPRTNEAPPKIEKQLSEAAEPAVRALESNVATPPRDKFEALAVAKAGATGGDYGAFGGNTSDELAKRTEYRARGRLNMIVPEKVKREVKADYLEPNGLSWTDVLIEGLQLVGQKHDIESLKRIPDWVILNRNNR